ncbi:MAG TPA: hypothetical protein VKU44_01045 [Terriglobia bacterium]|nr:hypothetical protein [Terriglobia bacterium]
MPNPTDFERLGNGQERAKNLLESALDTAKTKLSWSEWFGGGSWLGQLLGEHASNFVGSQGAAVGGTLLLGTLGMITGTWVVVAGGAVVLAAFNHRIEDGIKDLIPSAIQKGKQAINTQLAGAGGDPAVLLDAPIKKMLNGEEEVYSLEETIERIKKNSALLQDLLNKLAGKAGKPYFCDDAYQIATLAYKCDATKGELKRDTILLREFLDRMETDLDKIDHVKILQETLNIAKQICDQGDGRHWDNTWTAATLKRGVRCSKEHCFGPRG